MAQEWAINFYRSSAWLKCRVGYITSVHGLCERCTRGGYIVHHKIPLTPHNINDPEVALNWEHLEYLCMDCHNKEHFSSGEPATVEGVRFNEYGELVRVTGPP